MAAEVLINIKAVDQASGVLRGVTGALGKMAAIAVGAGVAAFGVMAKGALDATAEYEKLTLQLETLSAREIKNADSTLTMKDALVLAKGETQELLKWTQALAIHSPFDQATVADSLQQAMNYGFTSDQAKVLTQNLIDMGAGMGWTSEKMGLVSYAMGQINQSGNLMTQDLRQLMSAGVPVNDILATMGYSLKDVGTKAISSADFLKEFNKMVGEDFEGAADRMTKSWGGMLSTFEDIKKIGLRTLFKDTFTALQPMVGALQDWILGPGLEKLEEWGASMGRFTTGLIDFASDSSNFDLSDLTGKFRDFMRGVDWQQASDDLVAGINAIDWVAVGQEVRTGAANIWKGLKYAADNINWQEITSALGSGIGGVIAGLAGYISWDAFALDLSNKLAGAFGYAGDNAIYALAADFSAGFNFIKSNLAVAIFGIKMLFYQMRDAFLTVLVGMIGIAGAAFAAIGTAIAMRLNAIKASITSLFGGIAPIFGKAGAAWMTALAQGITSGITKVIKVIALMVAKINQALSLISLPNWNVSIPNLPSVTGTANGTATGTGGVAPKPKPKPGQVGGFAGGGISSGPNSGYLALLHGTEGVFTREQMAMLSPAGAGGGVIINLTYAPAFSTASADEVERQLMPFIQRGIRQSRRA